MLVEEKLYCKECQIDNIEIKMQENFYTNPQNKLEVKVPVGMQLKHQLGGSQNTMFEGLKIVIL